MKPTNTNIETAANILRMSVADLSDMWSNGQDVSIKPMVDLESPLHLGQKSFFLYNGIIREYFLGNDGSEHTVRILQGPAFISPSMNNIYRVGEPPLISQSLTKLEGRVWDLQFSLNQTFQHPAIFRSSLKTIVEAVKVKVKNEVRRHECSAKERYLLFNKDFPGLVNLIPLKYIASYLNMTPETISRIRNNMSKR